MAKVKALVAREIIDSRGNPTVEVEISSENYTARSAVPSGASTGAHEAHELRDGDKERFFGKGVLNAIENVQGEITSALQDKDLDWRSIDQTLIALDGTENKSRLGANAILGVSLAAAHLEAKEKQKELFELFKDESQYELPVPLMNVLNGGAHANNGLDVQEFMIAPFGFPSFSEALRAGCEIFQVLKKVLSEKGLSTAVGDEGGFAPVLKSNQEALELLLQATEKAGYKPGEQVALALDVAATELYADSKYTWDGEKISASELSDVYKDWCERYPLKSIEDGLAEDDWQGWGELTSQLGEQLQLVGDDLFVTNPKRLKQGIDSKTANALLVKVNQIGTLTETEQAVKMAAEASYTTVMSHRSGETEDVTIADLSVGMGSQQIKTGSLCRGERTAKYNQLLRIESKLGSRGSYWGERAFQK
jgi:enolase